MRLTHLTFLVSISSPFIAYASHISARQEGPFSRAPRPVPVSETLAPGSAPLPVLASPNPPGSLKDATNHSPLGVNSGVPKGFPDKASPPQLGSKRTRIEKHRRQFHNADFASSGSPPSSDIESAASADEVHERRFLH